MLNEVSEFIQRYPKLFIFIIVEIVYIIVFFRDLLRIKERPSNRKLFGYACEGIVLILSIILLVIFISFRDSII